MAEKKADVFDLEGIRRLLELMNENNVSELHLEREGSCLKLSRGGVAVVQAAPVAVQAAPAPVAAQAPAAQAAPAQAPQADDSAFMKTIVSPMVGTFYASPKPEKPAFVKVGDAVSPDKTVCIIEAMKTFNDVKAEISGKIVEILVKNGEPVEFGKPLFKVDVRG